MLRKSIEKSLPMLALLGCLVSGTAAAQDFGSFLKNVLQNKAVNLPDMVKSITDLTTGNLAQGVQTPADMEGKFVLFSTATCPYCKQAISYMQQKNIPFVERNIENNSGNKAEYKRLGGRGVPFIVYGDKTMSGFSESGFERYFPENQRLPGGRRLADGNGNGDLAATSSLAGPLQAGDTLIGKIPGVTVYLRASKTAQPLMTLAKEEEIVYMGDENMGLYRVTSSRGEGWVDKLLVRKH
jgi:glutaredoxin